ncbi:hypothetical protein FGO68_gene5622 [Halteria grandinella]|uniref:Uncharacterized protein n=1 Tax=Halteria grandinella TaxID=5974 RepID=A0A8J8T8W7_HALGN|nr:hypothetical protein FGO68_gene5622 [Halteria grandinella]
MFYQWQDDIVHQILMIDLINKYLNLSECVASFNVSEFFKYNKEIILTGVKTIRIIVQEGWFPDFEFNQDVAENELMKGIIQIGCLDKQNFNSSQVGKLAAHLLKRYPNLGGLEINEGSMNGKISYSQPDQCFSNVPIKNLKYLKITKIGHLNQDYYNKLVQNCKDVLEQLTIVEQNPVQDPKDATQAKVSVMVEPFLSCLLASSKLHSLKLQGIHHSLDLPFFTSLTDLTIEWFDEHSMQTILEREFNKALVNLSSLTIFQRLIIPAQAFGGPHPNLRKLFYKSIKSKRDQFRCLLGETVDSIVFGKREGFKMYAPFKEEVELDKYGLKAILIDIKYKLQHDLRTNK